MSGLPATLPYAACWPSLSGFSGSKPILRTDRRDMALDFGWSRVRPLEIVWSRVSVDELAGFLARGNGGHCHRSHTLISTLCEK
jgi:hypothetical protein